MIFSAMMLRQNLMLCIMGAWTFSLQFLCWKFLNRHQRFQMPNHKFHPSCFVDRCVCHKCSVQRPLRTLFTSSVALRIVPYIPLISQVFGSYCKLWTKVFAIDLWPKHKACSPYINGKKFKSLFGQNLEHCKYLLANVMLESFEN